MREALLSGGRMLPGVFSAADIGPLKKIHGSPPEVFGEVKLWCLHAVRVENARGHPWCRPSGDPFDAVAR